MSQYCRTTQTTGILLGFQEICGRLKNLENLEISISLLNVQGFKNLDRLPVLKTLKLSMGVPKLVPKEAFHVFATLPALTELDLGVPAYGTDLSGLYGGCGSLRTLKITGMAATDELLLEWAQKLPHSVVNLHIKGATPEGSYIKTGCFFDSEYFESLSSARSPTKVHKIYNVY